MQISDFGWILSGVSILGSILNVYKKKVCFIVWNIGNLGWIILGLLVPTIRPQLPLWLVFSAINIWGYLQWKKEKI